MFRRASRRSAKGCRAFIIIQSHLFFPLVGKYGLSNLELVGFMALLSAGPCWTSLPQEALGEFDSVFEASLEHSVELASWTPSECLWTRACCFCRQHKTACTVVLVTVLAVPAWKLLRWALRSQEDTPLPEGTPPPPETGAILEREPVTDRHPLPEAATEMPAAVPGVPTLPEFVPGMQVITVAMAGQLLEGNVQLMEAVQVLQANERARQEADLVFQGEVRAALREMRAGLRDLQVGLQTKDDEDRRRHQELEGRVAEWERLLRTYRAEVGGRLAPVIFQQTLLMARQDALHQTVCACLGLSSQTEGGGPM